MADTTTTKILEVVVDNNKAVSAISEYNRLIDEQKAKQAALAKAYADGKISQSDYYKAMAQSKEVTKTYSRQVQELSKEIQNNIKADTEKQGSLRALRAELSNVTKAYDELSEEERRSAKGMELQSKINAITADLKSSEQETGRFYRNVGNYANGFVEAFTRMGGSMGNLKNPIGVVKNGFMAISSTPLIAILGALVSIIQKVIQNLKSSESSMQAVTAALAPLNAGSRLLTKVMQALGNGIVKVVETLTKWADKLGLITEEMKVEQQLVKDEIALQMREREVMEQNAESQLKISQLKAKAADKSTYSAKERLAFLQEALAEEDAIAKRELETAQERLRILEEQSKLAENSKEENDALAQARVDALRAEQAYFDKSRELTAQMVEAKNAIAAEDKAAAEARKAAADAEIEAAERQLQALVKAEEHALDIKTREIEARLKLVEEGSLREYQLQQELLAAQLEADLKRLEAEEGTDELIKLRREEYLQEMAQLDEEWEAETMAIADEILQESLNAIFTEQEARKQAFDQMKQQEMEKQQLAQDTALAFGSVAGSIAGMLQAFGEENRELGRLSKVLALAQIAIETGVATAKGISAAMSTPFPGNLVAIATTVATIISGMTSAISTVKSAKFATGGLVTGPGTGTSDSISARLSNGESVINARSTSMFGPLLSSLNQAGGGVAFNPATGGQREGYEFLAAAVASGMKSVQIRMGLDEITRVQDRVNTLNEISTIE
ncbi:MAG: hypothetical protein U0K19_04945 [Bifidobacteriaceae bacterium]|nr:hypothetical protein [Bifidobacteriaceae bacterium]